MATTAPAQIQLGGTQDGQSAWHHAVKTYGDMGQQHAATMTGGRRRQSKRQRRQSKKQRQSRKVDRRQSKRQRGGRR